MSLLSDLAVSAHLSMAFRPGHRGVENRPAATLGRARQEYPHDRDLEPRPPGHVARQLGPAEARAEEVDDHAGLVDGQEASELADGVDFEELADGVAGRRTLAHAFQGSGGADRSSMFAGLFSASAAKMSSRCPSTNLALWWIVLDTMVS